MTMSLDVKRIERNAYRASLADGLLDLFLGVYLLLLAGAFRIDYITFPAILGFIFGVLLLRRLKSRLTHPRIGFVEFPQEKPKKLLLGMLAVSVLAALVVAAIMAIAGEIRHAERWYQWSPLFIGLVMLAPLLPMAARSGLVRYYILAAVSFASGLGVSLVRPEGRFEGLSLHLLIVGAIAALMGAITLFIFLRRNPLPSEEIPDDAE